MYLALLGIAYLLFLGVNGLFDSEKGRTIWRFTVAGVAAWYFFGYSVSLNYWSYKWNCRKNAGFHLVTQVATNIPYQDGCHAGAKYLLGGKYDFFDCKYKNELVRISFVGGDIPSCTVDSIYGYRGDFDDECFLSESIENPETPYTKTYEELKKEKSWLFKGYYKESKSSVILADGTLVAYQKRYRYYPQGNDKWLSGSSGSPRVESCAGEPFDFEQMFPSSVSNIDVD